MSGKTRQRPHGRHARSILIIHVQAMREHCTLSQQAMLFVDVQVAAAVGKQPCDLVDLVHVLGQMRVNPDVGVLAGQSSRGCELLWRGGERKARRNRIAKTPFAMPALDQCLAVGVTRLRVVAQVLRAVAVHQNLARDQPHAFRVGGLENSVSRVRVHGAEYERRCRTVREQLVDEHAGDFTRVVRIGEFCFGRKGVPVEPVEQLRAIGADDIELRKMHMAVDKSGNDELASVVDDWRIGRQLTQQFRRIAGVDDVPLVDDQQAVFEIFVGRPVRLVARIGKAVQNRCAQRLHYTASSITIRSSECVSQFASLPPRSTIRKSWPASKAIRGICQVPR